MSKELYLKRQKEKERKRLMNQEARAKRSPDEQLARLDKLLGKDQGAKKERARLLKQIEEEKKNNIKAYKETKKKEFKKATIIKKPNKRKDK